MLPGAPQKTHRARPEPPPQKQLWLYGIFRNKEEFGLGAEKAPKQKKLQKPLNILEPLTK